MNGSPNRATPDEAMTELLGLIRKLGARTVEFGYHVDGLDQDRDPDPDEEITWWAKAQHRGGPVWTAEERGPARSPWTCIEALAGLARKMGGSVRIRWEEA